MNNKTENSSRTIFFDNLRSLMVLLVLIFHSGASYGSGVEFWPFHDKNPSRIIDIFMFLCDVFMMAILFFIAGFFTLPNLQKKGTLRFITGKLKRLGLPWLIITIIILPILDYIYYYVQHFNQVMPLRSFWEHWILSVNKIMEFHIGWIDMSRYWNMNENFYQRYMWFISLLLLFFILFALVHKINLFMNIKPKNQDSIGSELKPVVIKPLATTAIIMIILFSLIRFLVYREFMAFGWFSLGNIIQFQFGKLIIYICCFGLGIYAFSQKWFTNNAAFGKAWIWALMCFCLFGLNMLVLKNLKSVETQFLIAKIAFCALYPLWSLSFLGFFVSWTYRHWNRPTRFNMNLSNNSYYMYMVHYIFPFTLPLILKYLEVSSILKFGILSVGTILFSYLISRYVMKSFYQIIRTRFFSRSGLVRENN
jgi:glucans biosynthesis protein C